MKKLIEPFNITLLTLTKELIAGIKPVTKLDIMEGGTTNFNEDGLFSVSIFGQLGSTMRYSNFSYIDIKVDVFHPVVFKALCSLKRMYGEIMAGKVYAKWDEGELDFTPSTELEGDTGFHFFVKHWEKITFMETGSDSRKLFIDLINKYKKLNTCMNRYITVIPAGMRDISYRNGRMDEDEVNPLYRKLLSVSNSITESAVKSTPDILDQPRYSLQVAFNVLYEHFANLALDGKKKLFLDKFAGRRIFNGTRNVFSAMDTSTEDLDSPNAPNINHTVIGLYQLSKAILPVTIYNLRNSFLKDIFFDVSQPATLVDKKTLKATQVKLKAAYFDRWATPEGLEKIISSFSDDGIRHDFVEVSGHYLALIYIGPDNTFKVISDIELLPEGFNKENVRPITFAELMYICLYRIMAKIPLYITRYPITGIGSIYPSLSFVKTTIKSKALRPLDDYWKVIEDDEFLAGQFPIIGEPFLNSLVPHSSRLQGMGGDYDGDTGSANAVYSVESVKEVNNLLNKRRAYVGAEGNFLASCSTDTVNFVLYNLTGDADV